MKALLWLAFLSAPQDPEQAGLKALDYLEEKIPKSNNWARYAQMSMTGLACIAEGSTPSEGRYTDLLNRCIRWFEKDGRPGDNQNWCWALGGIFLAEVHKRWPTPERAERLGTYVERIEKNQNSTGGWTHKPGFKYRGREDNDICFLTGLMIAALENTRAAGVEVPQEVLDRAYENIRRLSRNGRLAYGSHNPAPDAGTRGGGVLMGLYFAGLRDARFQEFAGALREGAPNLDRGHAFPAMHVFNSAVGNFLAGNFGAFKSAWFRRLIQQQEKDGGIWMKDREGAEFERKRLGNNVVSTAVFALVMLLERDNVFKAKPQKKKARSPARSRRSADSPFGRRR